MEINVRIGKKIYVGSDRFVIVKGVQGGQVTLEVIVPAGVCVSQEGLLAALSKDPNAGEVPTYSD